MPNPSSEKQANRDLITKSAEVALRISSADGLMERELMQTKWFDYRFMSPLDATELFVREYTEAYRNKWATNFDTVEAEKKIPIRGGAWRSNRSEFISCWRARQFVDCLGVPY